MSRIVTIAECAAYERGHWSGHNRFLSFPSFLPSSLPPSLPPSLPTWVMVTMTVSVSGQAQKLVLAAPPQPASPTESAGGT
jgi:hypothetical protein